MDVAIIGAGISGLALSLTLHSQNIKSTIYERRSEAAVGLGSTLVLYPSSVGFLSKLGFYEQLRKHGVEVTTMELRDENFTVLKTVQVMDTRRYEYPALRIKRRVLMELLRGAVAERGIEVFWETRLEGINRESEGMKLTFTNGLNKIFPFVIGADGIHSSVRSLVFPNAVPPVYSKSAAVTWTIPKELLGLMKENMNMITLQTHSGAVMYIPENVPEYILSVMTLPLEDRDPEEWRQLYQDKKRLLQLLQGTIDEKTTDRIKGTIEHIETNETDAWLWPFYFVSHTQDWVAHTGSGNVALVGDAAHGFPPWGGAGANMALEDATSLVLVLKHVGEQTTLEQALEIWQEKRHQRLDRVVEYVRNFGKGRIVTKDANAAKADVGMLEDLAWLHTYRPEDDFSDISQKT